MSLRDVVDALARSPTVRDHTVQLPDPDVDKNRVAPSEGYISVRLTEMRLTDRRRWLQDITPALFVIGEYDYNGARVRKPCFVSNKLLGDIGHGIDAGKLHVNFANKLVLGPTPYAGGDVELFVGLFQTATEERLTAMFGVFETLFGKIGGPVAAGIALAHELLPAMLKCLGRTDVRCLLADYRPIGEQSLPTECYLAYLRGDPDRAVDTGNLAVRDRQLVRKDDPNVSVDDVDYCLIRVQCAATRGDYQSLPFHKLWLKAMELTGAQRHQDAQAFMLECSSQILASPDLTESHKIGLLEEYQARILAARAAVSRTSDGSAERAGTELSARGMRERVRSSGEFNAPGMAERMNDIARRSVAIGSGELDDVALDKLLAAAPRGRSAADTAALVRTLTLGSIAQ